MWGCHACQRAEFNMMKTHRDRPGSFASAFLVLQHSVPNPSFRPFDPLPWQNQKTGSRLFIFLAPFIPVPGTWVDFGVFLFNYQHLSEIKPHYNPYPGLSTEGEYAHGMVLISLYYMLRGY
jgi:hypothetical protein